MQLRVIFAGTPEFAVPSLYTLIESGIKVKLVITQPDRRRGRGRKLSATPVRQFADMHNINVVQTAKIDKSIIELISSIKPDLIVVVAFGMLLPKSMLELPRLGCLNVHASLLPRWRGAAPIARAIEAADSQTGVTIMQMDEGLDTGMILSQLNCPIAADDTAETLELKLAELGASQLLKTIDTLMRGEINPLPQNDDFATYADKLSRQDAPINWSSNARSVVCKIHALNPWPVAESFINGNRLRIWNAELSETYPNGAQPGEVVAADKNGILVCTGDGVINLTIVQRDGKNKIFAADYLAGNPIALGTQFEYRGVAT